MQTYFLWLTRILVLLALICLAVAAYLYLFADRSGEDGKAAATFSAALLGTVGFGFTALFTNIMARNRRDS